MQNSSAVVSYRVKAALISLLAMVLVQFSDEAFAQAYPSKPIRWVLAFGAPGGAPDTIARTVGPKLTEAWGQQIIVDPRTGAGGTIATEIVAKSPPDGYTILLASPSHAIPSPTSRRCHALRMCRTSLSFIHQFLPGPSSS
jgi:tripartite-type tricarboxylate transporter receptor subunit TctC